MNRISKNLSAAAIVIAGCIYAGNVEHNDAVLSAMSDAKYQRIRLRLGAGAKPAEVVKEYLANRAFYDSPQAGGGAE